ncbi:hypothetical protein [Kordia jejudonensis]|uniref:hypothetical protein n=1 Tax=Kordia jejudonensis TaxID=1348245 RepID=UPI000629457A|nr:hypothetical protein [Kordia jejudonensis]
MKKRNLKSLQLNKNKIADFTSNPIIGGLPPRSHFAQDCKEPDEVSNSCAIESNCLGCTVHDTVNCQANTDASVCNWGSCSC